MKYKQTVINVNALVLGETRFFGGSAFRVSGGRKSPSGVHGQSGYEPVGCLGGLYPPEADACL